MIFHGNEVVVFQSGTQKSSSRTHVVIQVNFYINDHATFLTLDPDEKEVTQQIISL